MTEVQVGDIWRYDWESFRAKNGEVVQRFQHYLILGLEHGGSEGSYNTLCLDTGRHNTMVFRSLYNLAWSKVA